MPCCHWKVDLVEEVGGGATDTADAADGVADADDELEQGTVGWCG